MGKYNLLLLLTFISFFCFGQVKTNYIKPIQTDINYSSSEDSSAVSRNSSIQLNKLFLFIGGTNSNSSNNYNALRLHAASIGFDFINLSYPNSVAAASLSDSNDSLVFDKYRQEINFGSPVSNDVSVDSLNSIYTRTLKILNYLDSTYPSENWGQYLRSPNTLNWSKIIVGGHSQGSGHASYLAKHFLVNRVLMFSGPNDYSNYFSNSAHWIRQDGVTPINNYFTYLSLNDEIVNFSKQFTNISGLGMLINDDTTHVDLISEPFNSSHCLYTTQKPGLVILNHNVPTKFSSLNKDVWTYMLTSDIPTNTKFDFINEELLIFPNPTHSTINIKANPILLGEKYQIHDLNGKLILTGTISQTDENVINLSMLKNGLYLLTIDNHTIKIIKN